MTSFIKVSDKVVIIYFHNAQGDVLYTFHLMSSMFFVSAPAYAISLTHVEHLSAVGCRLKGKLAQLLSLDTSHYLEQKYNWKDCNRMMAWIVRRVASKHVASMLSKAAKDAEELCASGQCAAALIPLKKAIYLGDLPSRALKAWMLLNGREGVVVNINEAFNLVEEGVRLGCHHCQGVMALCYLQGYGIQPDEARSMELARKSSELGSRYGQYMLGYLYQYGYGGVAQDDAQAVALYRLAAAQNLENAQSRLGYMYFNGCSVIEDYAEALRWYQLAGAQGHSLALSWIAYCHEKGRGIAENKAEAICWYRRAQAAGSNTATAALQRLCT